MSSGATAVQVVYLLRRGLRSAVASLAYDLLRRALLPRSHGDAGPSAATRAARLSDDLDQRPLPPKAPPSLQDA